MRVVQFRPRHGPRPAILAPGDRLTAPIGVASPAVLFRWKVHNALVIAATAAIRLVAYPLLQPAWVIVK